MPKKKTAAVLVLFLSLVGASSAAGVRKLSSHVSVCEGPVNGVFIERNGKILVIYGDPEQRLQKAEMIRRTQVG